MKILTDTAVASIMEWSRAYPLDVFPEPDMAKVREALEAKGITIDSVSASNMRHVIMQVKAIVASADEVPEGCTPTDARVLREGNFELAQEVNQALDAVPLRFRDPYSLTASIRAMARALQGAGSSQS